MMTGIVPFKTPEGHDELARRTRRLGQRHRTLLLLVDGRRSVDQVLALAHAAGVTEEHYRVLLEMGLIALPDGVLTAPTLPLDDGSDDDVVVDDALARSSSALDMELPILHASPAASAEAPAGAEATDQHETSPPAADLPPAAPQSDLESEPAGLDAPDWMPAPVDGPLEQAREVLVRALNRDAPIAGQLTLLKVRHAGDRAELEALLREVEERLARPRHRLAAARTMRHVRNLLRTPPDTAFTMY